MENIIKNAYIALLAGIEEIHKGGVKSIDECGDECYIHFPNFPSSTKVVVRHYWENGVVN